MSIDDTTPISTDVFNIPSYIDYRAEMKRLEQKGYHRYSYRPKDETINDLIHAGYQVVRIQSFDDVSMLPVEGVEVFVRKLEK
jgi:hypothetical protein